MQGRSTVGLDRLLQVKGHSLAHATHLSRGPPIHLDFLTL